MSSAEEKLYKLRIRQKCEREQLLRQRRKERRAQRALGLELIRTTTIVTTYKVLVGNPKGLTFEDIAEAMEKK